MRLNIVPVLVFLTLCMLTLGCVSASDEIDIGDNLTVDEISQDLNQNDNEILANATSEDDDYKDVVVDVLDIVHTDVYYCDIFTLYDDNYINGTIYCSIDGNVFTKTYDAKDEEWFCLLSVQDLKSIPSYGIHKVNFTYQRTTSDKAMTIIKDVEFTYSFKVNSDRDIKETELAVEYSNELDLDFELPENSNGVVTFTLNGKKYKVNIKKGVGHYTIKTDGFKIGEYTIKFKYKDNANKYPDRAANVKLKILPKITCQSHISTNEKDSILVYTPKGTNINLVVYENNDGEWGKKIASFTSKGGLYFIPVNKIMIHNPGYYYINYTVGKFSGYDEFDIVSTSNSKNLASKIVKKGDSVKVVLTGPKVDDFAEIHLDNENMKYLSLKKGKITKTLSNLDVGKHKITVKVFGSVFYSKTFYVTIKAKDKVSLSLKTVKVKKYAKKLVLKSTLKINKKAKKGLKVTFKFKGKTYKAKTNSKGIAKVKIPKKVLKKLKVGKKIKYQVKYSFKTVTKTAKVKK